MIHVVATSDLHGILPEPDFVPACDLLLIAGDICPVRDHSTERQKAWLNEDFRYWLQALKADKIVGVAGNHDFIAQKHPEVMYDLPWTYLCDEETTYEDMVIWGSPWTPVFGPWAFMDVDQLLLKYAKQIPLNTNILVTHGPLYGLGDSTDEGVLAGSRVLADRIAELSDLRLHVFGHIHEAFGDYPRDGVMHSNVSYVDLRYRPRPLASLRQFAV